MEPQQGVDTEGWVSFLVDGAVCVLSHTDGGNMVHPKQMGREQGDHLAPSWPPPYMLPPLD